MKVKIKVKNAAESKCNKEKVIINTEYITLDAAMKLTGIVSTGGQAKILVKDGLTKVNGKENDVLRKKLYPGDTFEFEGTVFEIKSE